MKIYNNRGEYSSSFIEVNYNCLNVNANDNQAGIGNIAFIVTFKPQVTQKIWNGM